jgi:hypothetical protein
MASLCLVVFDQDDREGTPKSTVRQLITPDAGCRASGGVWVRGWTSYDVVRALDLGVAIQQTGFSASKKLVRVKREGQTSKFGRYET